LSGACYKGVCGKGEAQPRLVLRTFLAPNGFAKKDKPWIASANGEYLPRRATKGCWGDVPASIRV